MGKSYFIEKSWREFMYQPGSGTEMLAVRHYGGDRVTINVQGSLIDCVTLDVSQLRELAAGLIETANSIEKANANA